MVRLYLFAEGQTEQTFATGLLRERLAKFDVYIEGVVLIAHARKKHKVHRGGGRNYTPMRNDIVRFLKAKQGDSVFFTTMIDLYAIHSEFPGLEKAQELRIPEERVEYLEQSFAQDIDSRRFIPYIQLHEFEACLFSDVACFEYHYPEHNKQIEALKAVAKEHETPEHIDDGQETAPSKRILKEFPDFAKPVQGPQIAELIGLDLIRKQCPHFNAWLARLEELDSSLADA